jgi:hypothetical protein
VSDRIGVVTALPDYVVAVGDLPRSARRVERAAGAIVVVDGSAEWWDAAVLVVEAGAAAVLVAEPDAVPLEAARALADRAVGWDVPILVHRARLRVDVLDVANGQRGGVAPRVTVAECRATGGDLPAMVRDAVGWMRELAGESLVVAAATVGAHAGTALLRARDDGHVVGSLLLAVTSPEGAVLRVQGLGEATTELEFDAPLGRSGLATSTVDGRLVAPARYETGERASLRRAVGTLVRGKPSTDLDQLLHDAEVASVVLEKSAHLPRL